MLKERYLTPFILDDLNDKMVFVGGPRQVGKTTLCRDFVAAQFKNPVYFNWDNRSDRKSISAAIWPGDADLLIFDEIHKYRPWKGFIKGEYDKHKGPSSFSLQAVRGWTFTEEAEIPYRGGIITIDFTLSPWLK